MRKTLLAATIGLFSQAPLLAGHPIGGSWQAEFQDARGNQRTVTFHFQESEGRLEGTVVLGESSLVVEDGRVEGKTLSFKVTLSLGKTKLHLHYSGELREGVLHLVQKTRGATRRLTARRL